jgi:hypothetical protein
MVMVEGNRGSGFSSPPDHVAPDRLDGTIPQQIHLDLWVEDFPQPMSE